MCVKKVFVSRSIVLEHGIHPELFGESIVILENGMWTDVYTDDDGHLYSMTNDDALIKYLNANQEKDPIIRIKKGIIKFRSLANKDCLLLNQWLTDSPFHRYDKVIDSEEVVRVFISQSRTINSHVFIVSKKKKFGTIGFTLIDNIAIVNFEIHKWKYILDEDIDASIELIIEYLKENYQLNKIFFNAFRFDSSLNKSYQRSGFKKHVVLNLIQTLGGTHKQFIYEYIL